jgi:type I restriction enzyme S subunit
MTALLTDNLPLLAGAPNGIKKLRELILELAIRGKLLPQDPNDEPAIELLQPIAEEKARLVRDGKLKKQKPSANIDTVEKPSDFPKGWLPAYLADIVALVTDGDHQPPPKAVEGVPFLVIGNLNTGNIRFEGCRRVPHNYFDALDWGRKPCQGDILYTVTGSFGIPIVVDVDEPFCVQRHVAIIKTTKHLPSEYLRVLLASPYAKNYAALIATGIAQKTVPLTGLRQLIVPLPPLAEQHRIVAKVDELMALCDRLEAQQANSEIAHTQLVQALLDSLAQASDAIDFATNWQRLAEHFHSLFTTEPSIDALKQTLLQLAVMGKLVPQDPGDEPVSELLRRVWETNDKLERMLSSGAGNDAERWFGISAPEGWSICKVRNIAEVKLGSTPSRAESSYWGGDIPWVSSGEVAGTIIKSTRERITLTGHRNSSTTMIPPGSVLIAMIGQGKTRGQSALLEVEACTNQNVAALIFNTDLIASRYVWLWAQAMYSLHRAGGHGGAQPALNAKKVKAFSLPLPPTAEQLRIVAKVDQLMTLCDQLKTRLTQARQTNEQLANTMIERALAEDVQQAPGTMDRQAARILLAAEITHQLHSQRTFGQRKLQKVIYLAEHTARLAAIQGSYLRDAAGPHDRQLMNNVEGEMQNHQWYERIERETVGHAYRPLSQAGQHRQAYSRAWSVAERVTIEQVIELMREWDTDRCEMTVTLYAAWNDFILERRPVSDEAIVYEIMHSWNDTKLRFGKTEWLAVLEEMKKHKILMPSGFGKRTTGGMLSLPGFD